MKSPNWLDRMAAVAASLLAIAPLAHGAPANDKFSAAVKLTGLAGEVTDATNVGATAEDGEYTSSDGATIWYSYVPTVTGYLKVSFNQTNSGSGTVRMTPGFGTKISAFYSVVSGETSDAANTGTIVTIAVQKGVKIGLQFDSDGGTGAFSFSYQFVSGGAFQMINPPRLDGYGNPLWTFSEKAGAITFNVARIGGSEGTATVQYEVPDDGDLAAHFSGNTSGTLTFGAGETEKTITLNVINDAGNVTGAADFGLVLSAASANAGVLSGYTGFTIEDKDGVPANDDFAHAITLVGSGPMQTTAGPATLEDGEILPYGGIYGASVWYRFQAQADGIFTVTSPDLPVAIFSGGSLATLQLVPSLTDESRYYPKEVSTESSVVVHAGTTYSIALYGQTDDPHDFTFDSSQPSLFRFAKRDYTVSESTGKATLTVERVGALTQAATVKFSTRQGTDPDDLDDDDEASATAGTDFVTRLDVLLSFASGQTTSDVDVEIKTDSKKEKSEVFSNYLSDPLPSGILGAPKIANVHIIDGTVVDDAGPFIYDSWSAPLIATGGSAQGFFKFKGSGGVNFTGSLIFLGKKYPVSGALVKGPLVGTSLTADSTVTIHRKNLSDLIVTLHVVEGGEEEFYHQTFTGTVSDGTNTASFTATASTSFSKLFPTPNAGTYTMTLTPNAQAPAALRAPGYASVTINAKGAAKWIGAMPDGSKISGGGQLAWRAAPGGGFFNSELFLPIFLPLYGGTGQVDGDLRFTFPGDYNAEPTSTGDGEGTLRWVHPGVADAFIAPLAPFVSLYALPPGDRIIPGTGTANLTVKFTGGNLTGGDATLTATLDPKSKGKFPVAAGASISFVTKKGLFAGKFTSAPDTKSPFGGAILRNISQGQGSFLNGDQSGKVQIQLAP